MKTDSQKRRLIHDIRNPLNAAVGISGILAADDSFTPAQKRKINVLKSSIEDLHRILEGAFLSEARPPVATEEEPGRESRAILLVEDYPPNALVMTEYLQELKRGCDLAETGQEAVEKYLNNRYDAILMDIQLPDIDGLEVTRRIRGIEKKNGLAPVPIIAISGMPEEREIFIRIGMTDCLTKPIELPSLKEKLDFYLAA
jgi:CheY-like chemotaxis protein